MSMANVLNGLLQSGMSKSGGNRLEHALGNLSSGGGGNPLSALTGGSGGSGGGNPLAALLGGGSGGTGSSGGALGSLGGIAESLLGGSGGGAKAGGLGALAGALLGGGGGAMRGALGGGAMALMASLAFNALKKSNQPVPSAEHTDSGLPLGLREPQNQDEQQLLENRAQLVLTSMITAAKADGQIDKDEMDRIVGKLQENGAEDSERQFVLEEMNKPFDPQGLISRVNDPETAAQVYAATFLAIEVDTPEERRYVEQLGQGLNLDAAAQAEIREMVGYA
ncbi:MAG: tellurite resistance TerB family protein [Geminicoccaceae bacterium]